MRELEEESLQLADRIGPKTHQAVSVALTPVRPPGALSRLVRRRGAGNVEADLHFSAEGDTWQLESALAQELAQSRDSESVRDLRDLLESIGRRRALSLQLGHELKLQAQIRIWLMLHVPLSFGLLAALISHIVSVFFYR